MKAGNKKKPLVSIVAVCFNHERFVKALLDSIRSQTYQNIETIILDDCSSDKSVEVIKQWIKGSRSNCSFVAHETNKGLCATLNEALVHCRGKYLQFIACDDILLPDKIAQQVNFLEKNPEFALVCSNFETIGEDDSVISKSYYARDYKFPEDPFGAILDGSYDGYHMIIHSPTVLIRREEIVGVGGYPENLMQEDFYMWLRITLEKKVAFQNFNSVKYRKLASSLSEKLTTGFKNEERYLKGHISAIETIKLRARGKRLAQLNQALLCRFEKLDELYIDNIVGRQALKLKLSDVMYLRNMLVQEYPGIEYQALVSLRKSIVTNWKKAPPIMDIYEGKLLAVPRFYRLLIKLNISYDFLTRARGYLSFLRI